MKRVQNNKNKKGFSILGVILVIVAVIVAIGVWALSGQTNTNNTGASSSDVQAAAIINDSSAIKLAYDNLIINGANPAFISFVPNSASTSFSINMLDPTTGIQAPKVSSQTIRSSPTSSEGYWVYNPTGVKSPMGSLTATDPVILVAGIKWDICARVNKILNGVSSVPTLFSVASSGDATYNAATNAPTSTASLDIGSLPAAAGWQAGCIGSANGGDQNFFFRVLKIN